MVFADTGSAKKHMKECMHLFVCVCVCVCVCACVHVCVCVGGGCGGWIVSGPTDVVLCIVRKGHGIQDSH